MIQDADEVSIEIEGTEFRFWTEVEINLLFDGHATVSFSAPFEPDNASFRETFRPFSYKTVRVLVGGDLLFTGTMVDIAPQVLGNSRSVSVTAYSRAAVLGDVTPPSSAHPLEFNGLTLSQISAKLLEPFGLTASLGPSASEGSKFERVKLEPKDDIQGFLSDLAKQRGLILGSDSEGNLVYRVTRNEGPVVSLSDSAQPVTGISVSYSPQSYFSEVTVLTKTKHGKSGGKYTAKNPFLSVLRPHVVELDETDPGDVKVAAEAKLGRMFGNALSFSIDLATWRTPDGSLWLPEQRISLTAPNAMVYEPTELLVRTVKLKRPSDKSKSANLTCVLPGSFSGVVPSVLPWGS